MARSSVRGWVGVGLFTRAGVATVGLAVATTLVGVSCATNGASPATIESPAARSRIDDLRARFVSPTHGAGPLSVARGGRLRASSRSALGAGVATGFFVRDGLVQPVIPSEARRSVMRPASVTLPVNASAPVQLEDDTSHLAVSFVLRGASDTAVTVADGVALYSRALGGADVLHRVDAEGTEDYVVFEQRPSKEELTYDVDVSGVAGLRLVSNTLEFLDDGGAPRLRVAPPYVVDTKGCRYGATLLVEGCTYDTSPSPPWGRAVTAPRASRCTVRVAWTHANYPAMVDPSWTATGKMAAARYVHTAALLGSGRVLLLGGANQWDAALQSAELYDPPTGSFATTGAMTTARVYNSMTLLGPDAVLVAGGETVGIDSGDDVAATAELYDAKLGMFAATGPMAGKRTEHTATLLPSGKVLVTGGLNVDNGALALLATAELYDPLTGKFSPTGSMAAARNHHTATLVGSGKVLVAGGAKFSGTTFVGALSSAELYDPMTGTFALTGSMTTPQVPFQATLLSSGKVLFAGGCAGPGAAPPNCVGLSSAELYDPMAGTFAATGSLTTARYVHSMTVLGSGEVLLAGGNIPAVASTEVYDPTAGTFTPSGSMAAKRENHSATLLGSGKVLIAGGWNGGVVYASAELFTEGPRDAGTDGSTDAGSPPPDAGNNAGPSTSGGCSCQAVPHDQVPPLALLYLGVPVGITVRLLRRRARTGRP